MAPCAKLSARSGRRAQRAHVRGPVAPPEGPPGRARSEFSAASRPLSALSGGVLWLPAMPSLGGAGPLAHPGLSKQTCPSRPRVTGLLSRPPSPSWAHCAIGQRGPGWGSVASKGHPCAPSLQHLLNQKGVLDPPLPVSSRTRGISLALERAGGGPGAIIPCRSLALWTL